ncbi:lipocalin family protein [Geobacter grbiciae]|uniref:lipocalin family protein n=1 Tax=Geobacter grbiciae TaxID=155042 RepID=UPI001C01CCCC|nr:lipocalin family protein [Geobacter grbiciae]MBT1074005.1 lipocalin family protein [Geobacter grbiciae]
MKILIILTVATALTAGFACRAAMEASASPPLLTVEYVDLNRYVGTWHEIARYPNSFQKGCLGSTASYTLRQDGEIDVVNSCRDAEEGEIRQAKGRAWVVDKTTNARLKVSFFWPFRGDYWIIDMGKEYEYAVVGTPNRKYLWVLSRTPVMDDTVYAAIMERVRQLGFDPGNVVPEAGSVRTGNEP